MRGSNIQIFWDKKLSPGQYWKAPTHADTIEFSNVLLQLKSQKSGSKTVCDSF